MRRIRIMGDVGAALDETCNGTYETKSRYLGLEVAIMSPL